MFASKFLQPVRLARKNLTSVRACLLASQSSTSPPIGGAKPDKFHKSFKTSRCGSLQETLAKCTKACAGDECKAPGPRDEKCPELPQHPAEFFKEACAKVTDECKRLRLLVGNSSKEMMSSLKKSNSSQFKEVSEKIGQSLRDLNVKVDSMLKTNLECKNQKRKEFLQLCSDINAKIQIWNCENESGTHHIDNLLRSLECKVMERTDTALGVIRTCEGCVSPYCMQVNVVTSQREAMCILELTAKYVDKELDRINRAKREVVVENTESLNRLVAKSIDEISRLSEELDSLMKEAKSDC